MKPCSKRFRLEDASASFLRAMVDVSKTKSFFLFFFFVSSAILFWPEAWRKRKESKIESVECFKKLYNITE